MQRTDNIFTRHVYFDIIIFAMTTNPLFTINDSWIIVSQYIPAASHYLLVTRI